MFRWLYALAFAEDDSSLVQIVWRKSNFYAVAWYDSNVVFSHLSRKMCHNYVSVLQFYTERCVWKSFFYNAFNFNSFFFCHVIPFLFCKNSAKKICFFGDLHLYYISIYKTSELDNTS